MPNYKNTKAHKKRGWRKKIRKVILWFMQKALWEYLRYEYLHYAIDKLSEIL